MEKKISVIIPVYNVEKYIKNSVESVINQTYKNLEIILVDDGSTDESGKICDNFKKQDSRIKVIHKENGGLSSARNTGMKIVTGDLISFFDSDDYIVPYFYEYLYNLIEKYNVDIAEGEFLRISEGLFNEAEKIIDNENNKKEIKEEIITNKEALNELYGVKVNPYVKKVVVWNKLYKKDVIKNILFPEGRLHEDEFTTHKILFNAKKIISSNRIIHGYMQTQNSIMRKEISQKRVDDTLDSIISALNFFKNKYLYEIESKIMMRYLEYCVELSGKISKENSEDKVKKLQYLKERFEEFFENIKFIKKYISSDLEYEVVNVLEKVHKELNSNHQLSEYWDELNKILSDGKY